MCRPCPISALSELKSGVAKTEAAPIVGIETYQSLISHFVQFAHLTIASFLEILGDIVRADDVVGADAGRTAALTLFQELSQRILLSLFDVLQGLQPGELASDTTETTDTLLRLLTTISHSSPKLAELAIGVCFVFEMTILLICSIESRLPRPCMRFSGSHHGRGDVALEEPGAVSEPQDQGPTGSLEMILRR